MLQTAEPYQAARISITTARKAICQDLKEKYFDQLKAQKG